MEPRFQRRVQRYGWDKAAEFYEQAWQAQLAEAQQRLMELAAAQPGERVLDIACGTGLVTFPIAEQVGTGDSGGTVVGTDISEQMVERCRETAQDRDFANVTFERMGAEELSLPDGSFDLVICSLGLMYVPEPVQALREMQRVLKPGGRMAVLVWGQRSNCGWAEIFPIVDARVKSEVCPLFFQLGAEGVLEQSLASAEFANIRCERSAYAMHFAGDEDACAAAFEGGPVALAYDRFDERTRSEAHGDYLASIESFKNGQGYDIPSEFVLATGTKAG